MERTKTPRAISIIRAGRVGFVQNKAGGTTVWTPGKDGIFARLSKSFAVTFPLMREKIRSIYKRQMVQTMNSLPAQCCMANSVCPRETRQEAQAEFQQPSPRWARKYTLGLDPLIEKLSPAYTLWQLRSARLETTADYYR